MARIDELDDRERYTLGWELKGAVNDVRSAVRYFSEPELGTVWYKDTLDGVSIYVDAYKPGRFRGDFPIIIDGLAGQSRTVRGLSWNGKPHLEWVVRELQIAMFALRNRSFEELSLYDLIRVSHLVRLTEEEGESLDENIARIWRENNLELSARGDTHCFTRWARQAGSVSQLESLREMPFEEFVDILGGVAEFNYEHGLVSDASEASAIRLGEPLRVLSEASGKTVRLKTALFDFEMSVRRFLFGYVVLVGILSYLMKLVWKRYSQDVASPPYSLTGLLGEEGRHLVFNLLVMALFQLLVLSSLFVVCLRAFDEGAWLSAMVSATGFVAVTVIWVGSFKSLARGTV